MLAEKLQVGVRFSWLPARAGSVRLRLEGTGGLFQVHSESLSEGQGAPGPELEHRDPPTHRRTPTAKAGLDLPTLPASLSAWQRQIFQLTFSAVLIATISHMYVTYYNSIPPLPCSPPTPSQLIFLLLLRVCMGGGTRQLRPLCVYDCNSCTAPRRQDCIALLSRF